jgi:DNA invertase Pin-like site-specific DNA recombinase/ferredoxin-like protein FixX
MARRSRKNIETSPITQTPYVPQKSKFYAGAYVRLSAIDKRNKGDSIENQQAIIKAFIDGRNDIELREIYIDNGHSGQSFERPEFKRMLADMENGVINCCISKDLSRLGRNAIDSGYYIEKHFPSIGVRYIAITDNYDSADGQSGGIMVSLKNLVNEAYALDVSRKIKATIRMNIRKGKFIGSSAPFGYFKSSEDCHQLVVDEYAALIVRRMFEMAADGQSHQSILAWLNDNRIMPPRRYFNSIGLASDKETGALTEWWSLRAVRDTLSNRVYYGVMIQGRSQMKGGIQVKLPESEWTVTENAHEAIISRALYDKTQETWVRKSVPKEPYYKTPNTENVFAKKTYCAQCGHAILRKRGGERYYRYFCNVGIMYTKDACKGVKIPENALKSVMLDMIRQYESFLSQSLQTTVNTATAGITIVANNLKDELAAVQFDLDRNSRFLKGLYESLVQGDISESEYKDMKQDYETKIAALTARVKFLRESIHINAEQEKAFTQAHKNVQTIEQISDLTAEIIDSLVEKIIIHQDGRLEVKFRFLNDMVFSSQETETVNTEGGALV